MSNKNSYRKYDNYELVAAAKMVKEQKISIYKAAKTNGVPWSSLKDFLKCDNFDLVPKMGRPFALTADLEIQILNYIIKMQELGFGLTVLQVRQIAHKIATAANRKSYFNEDKESASKWWWANFKKRYNLTLRVPENLAAYRASIANSHMINGFYSKLDSLMNQLGIQDMPKRFWNCDETGLSYVVKNNKVVTAIGKRYVYKRTYADRGETHTLLGCICANGSWIPPLIIFKGVRWNDSLKSDCLSNCMVKLSPKECINSDLFLEWFRFFIDSIPSARPVILFMDSHASHINMDVITLARENQIYLFTFPAHTSHLLQPLDVGVYKPLKLNWATSLNHYMRENPGEKPNRTTFHTILNPAFIKSFFKKNIENAFKKSGICPLNKDAIPPEAIAPSQLTNRDIQSTESQPHSIAAIQTVLTIPSVEPTTPNPNKPKRDSSAKCLTPVPVIDQPITSTSKEPICEFSKKKGKKASKNDDWECRVCKKTFNNDVQKKNGKKWVQCSYSLISYHESCQTYEDIDEVFMCDICCQLECDLEK